MGKISSYPQDTAPSGDDVVITIDTGSGSNRKVALSDLLSYMFTNVSASQLLTAIAGLTHIGEDLVINGNFDVWQRGTTFTPNDDTYTADRWNCLQEANAATTFSQDSSNVPTSGSKYSMKIANVTANMQNGLVYFLEGKDAAQLINQNVSLSFYAKTQSLQISNIRCAILSWTSTEDVITSDVVGTWAQNGTNPTWATNWTMENTPSNLALTNSWQKFTIENVAIDTAGMKNVAIVFWVDDGTITSGDTWWLSQVQMNVGIKALPQVPTTYQQELAKCERYYEVGRFFHVSYSGAVSTNLGSSTFYKTKKRTTPTIVQTNISQSGTLPATPQNADVTDVHYLAFRTATGAGAGQFLESWTADAEL